MSKEWAIKIKTVDMEEKPLAEGEKTMVDFSTDTAKEAMPRTRTSRTWRATLKMRSIRSMGARALLSATPPPARRRRRAPPPRRATARAARKSRADAPASHLRSGTWHVVVGENYATNVVHATKHFIFFYIGPKAILIFKSG